MNLTIVKNKITSKVGRQILITQKHSPVILFGVGVTGFVAAAVLASHATLKMDAVLREAEETRNKIDTLAEEQLKDNRAEYTAEDAKKDKALNKVKLAGKIAKLYAPAFVVGVVSIGALTGSHVILTRRNVGLTAAYAALDKGYRDYRSRVIKEFGEEKDREFRYDLVDREIAIETDEGPVVKTVKVAGPNGKSPYVVCFDESNPNWQRDPMYNQTFLRIRQSYADDMLHANGHVLLNDVFDMLGMKRTSAGAVVGWVRNNGDNYIDFGVFNDIEEGKSFVKGDERSIWLDFNVDGVVYDLIESAND